MLELMLVMACLGCLGTMAVWVFHALDRLSPSNEVSCAENALEAVYAFFSFEHPEHEARSQHLYQGFEGQQTQVFYWRPDAAGLESTPIDATSKEVHLILKDKRPKALYVHVSIPPFIKEIPLLIRR